MNMLIDTTLHRLLPPAVLLLALVSCGGPGGTPPVADAGEDMEAAIGQVFDLDGQASSDADGDALSFSWRVLTEPAGSALELHDADTATASATAEVAGAYTFELTVGDGSREDADQVTVTAKAGTGLTADAGEDVVAGIGDTVQLDGRGSSDAEGASLTFAWSFTDAPDGSAATFHDATSRTPRFTVDLPDRYEIQLTVSNGSFEATDHVTVRGNRPPSVDAGPDQEVRVGETVTLAGSGSDPDGDTLDASWTFVSLPPSATSDLQNASDLNADFAPDAEGDYVLELTRSDGHAEASDRVTVTAIPASGTVSSELFVATTGDDGNPGTEAEPFATLGAALSEASSNPDIARIRFAAGVYDAEAYDYEVDADLQLVGPEIGGGTAVLVAPDDLLAVVGDASLAIVRLTLRAGATAVDVGSSAKASLVRVTCEAAGCVRSGVFLFSTGGSVSVFRSELQGTGTGTGVSVTVGDGVAIDDSTIEGFKTGVSMLDTVLTLRDSTIHDNGTGLSLLVGSSTEVIGGAFTSNGVGLSANGASGVTLRDLDIDGSDSSGVEVEMGGAVLLDDVRVRNGAADGITIGEANSDAEVVTLRQSHVTGNLGHGIAVYGNDSVLDLGSRDAVGGNGLTNNKLASLYDARPPNAGGQVTLNDTILDSAALPQPSPGTYDSAEIAPYDVTIVENNVIVVY